MNEKIKELAEQAVDSVVFSKIETIPQMEQFAEKFAEVLLNELADTAVISDGYINGNRQLSVKLHLDNFRKRIPIIGD
jgi:hypothetical protein